MTEQPPAQPPPRSSGHAASLVIVNTGDGKGKTTAAMGTLLRAVSRGWRVCVVQFIKSGSWRVGEEDVARGLGVDWVSLGEGFSWDSEDLERDRAAAASAWEEAHTKIRSGDYDVIVLDEVTYPMNWGWISTGNVVQAIRERPARVNVIATGRDAPPELVEVADTVTEMTNVKHAFDSGIAARRGIDF
ncbi:MAG: cob(I)yrinic acid a,c-diamide adenosyltransferase [Actinomycetota bacterium]